MGFHRPSLGSVENRFIYCAPLRCAQACGARKAPVLSIPSTYESAWAQEPRPRWLDPSLRSRAGCAGLLYSAPCGGWCFAGPNVTAPIFILLGGP
jgi:hypothetical protein